MDHAITVEPGAEFPVQAGGDFVFCKFADRDIRVIIQNSPRTMRAGSKWRPAGGFEAGDLIVQNPDPVNPVAVVMTIGTGDFDDQIIRGEVTVNPGIRNALGEFVPDNRYTVDLMASLTSQAGSDYDLGDTVFEFDVPNSGSGPDHSIYGVEMVGQDEIWIVAKTADSDAQTIRIFSRGGRELGQIPLGVMIGGTKPIDGIEYNPTRDTVLLMNRDAQLTEITRGGVLVNQVSLASQLPEGFAAGDATGLAFLPERNELAVVAPIDNTLRIIDAGTLQALRSFDLGDYADGDVSTWQGMWFVAGSGTGFDGFLDPATGEITDVIADGGTNTAAVSVWARESLAVFADGLTVSGRVIEPVAFYGRGAVQSVQCGGGMVMTRPDDVPLRAEIYTHLSAGRYVATGEVIRAVLGMWGGAPVADGYLDHVFGIELPGDALNLQTGAETFARAGIRDAFTASFPGRVRLTIDNGLEWVK